MEWNSGTMEWNSGMVERWNTGTVDRAINDPVPFYSYKWTNWACALADIEVDVVWIRIPG